MCSNRSDSSFSGVFGTILGYILAFALLVSVPIVVILGLITVFKLLAGV